MAHPGLIPIPILLSIKIILPTQIQIQIKIWLETFHQNPSGSILIELTIIRS